MYVLSAVYPLCCRIIGIFCFSIITSWLRPRSLCIVRTLSFRTARITGWRIASVVPSSSMSTEREHASKDSISMNSTHEQISHLVASLPTSRQQVVFALLVTSCQKVWSKLLTTCNNLVDLIRLVARLFQQVRYIHSWYNYIVTTLCRQPCGIVVISWLHQTC